MPKPDQALVAVLVSKLDALDLLEDWEERASIMQFDALLPKGYAECLAMLDLLCRHPEVLDRSIGTVVLEYELGGATQWLLSADSNAAQRYLVDRGAKNIRLRNVAEILREHYNGYALLTTLD